MALLGNTLQTAYSSTVKDTFNGDGSTVAFTLSRPSRTNDVEVFVENVQQEPTVAYSVSGTTLTFTAAPASGTGNIYVVHRTQATQSLTVNTDDIVDGAITADKIADGAVTDPTPAAVSGQANTATDFFALPKGTTAQRPVSPANGYVRYNTTANYIEEYRGGSWTSLSNIFTATGGTETTATIGGTDYKIHTFTSSGTFTVSTGSATVDVLLVAGGGGGGDSGGAGAGGLISQSSLLGAGDYSITIGAGGAARSSTGVGNDGADTTAFSLTAFGGGGGAIYQGNGADGGSGGGSGSDSTTLGGSGTTGQGNDGGGGTSGSAPWEAGGGGGAGAVGGSPNDGTNTSGSGGAGVQNNIDGNNYYWAGGGGGGAQGYDTRGGSPAYAGNGGIGGGGGGGITYSSSGSAGTGGGSAINAGQDGFIFSGATSGQVGGNGGANTGGGGGGAGITVGQSGAGGSGIVIIRYAV